MDKHQQVEEEHSTERVLVHAISLDKQPSKPALKTDDKAERTPKSGHRVAFGGDVAEIAGHDPDSMHGSAAVVANNRRMSRDEIRRRSMDVPVKVVVSTFYGKIVKHPRLSLFFNDIDMPSLIRKQEAIMVYAFGGAELAQQMDNAADIRAIHDRAIREKGITLDDFDEFVRLFEETVIELEIPPATREQAVKTIAGFRSHFAT